MNFFVTNDKLIQKLHVEGKDTEQENRDRRKREKSEDMTPADFEIHPHRSNQARAVTAKDQTQLVHGSQDVNTSPFPSR